MDSRRDFLKKTAIAGGLVWAAPAVTSISQAGAQGTPLAGTFAVRITPNGQCFDLGANPNPAQCDSVAPGAGPGGCAHVVSVTQNPDDSVTVQLSDGCDYIEGTGFSRCQSGSEGTCISAAPGTNVVVFPNCVGEPGGDEPNHVEMSFTCG